MYWIALPRLQWASAISTAPVVSEATASRISTVASAATLLPPPLFTSIATPDATPASSAAAFESGPPIMNGTELVNATMSATTTQLTSAVGMPVVSHGERPALKIIAP